MTETNLTPAPEPAPQPAPVAAVATSTETVPVPNVAVTPAHRQWSNYVGGVLIVVAGFLVDNKDTIASLVPHPYNLLVTGAIGALGTFLLAYQQKEKIHA